MGFRQNVLLIPGSDWSIKKTNPSLWLDAGRGIGTCGARVFSAANSEKFALAAPVSPGTADFWISAWLYRTNVAAAHGIFRTEHATTDFDLQCPASATQITAHIGGTDFTTSAAGVPATTWTHVCVVYDRDGLATFYVNGVAEETEDISAKSGSNLTGTSSTIGALEAATYFNGSISRLGYGTGLLTVADVTELYNLGNGKYYAELSAGLAAKVTYYWNLNEASGNAIDAKSTNDGTDTNTVTANGGPREAQASDLIGGFHGTLTNMDNVGAWSSDVPDGSFTATKVDSVGTAHGTMTGFTDIDLAHVDGPDGQWGPHISNLGSGGAAYDGWLIGGVKDSRSASVPAALTTISYSGRFDGSSQRIDIPNQDFAGAFTFAAWTYLDDLSAHATIVGDTGDTNADGIRVDATTGHVSITVGGTNTVLTITGLGAGAWKHVAVTRAATTNALKVYVNGVDDTTGTPTQAGTLGFNAIGAAHSTPTAFFDGNIARVLVYDSALSAANIASLAAGTAVGAPTGDWKFDRRLDLPYLAGCRAVRFDGVDDHITQDVNPVKNSQNMSICCWFKKSAFASYQSLMSMWGWDGTNESWLFGMEDPEGTMTFNVLDGTNMSQALVTGVTTGEWNHLAGTFAGSTGQAEIYLNGVAGIRTLTGATKVGNNDGASAHNGIGIYAAYEWNGDLADCRIYNTALTQAQIRSIISGSDYTTGLAARWKFGETPRSIANTAGGYSLEFDGSDDRVAMTNQDLSAAFTLTGWVKPDSFAAARVLFGDTSDTNNDGLQIDATTGKISITVGGTNTVLSATALVVGQWQHVAVRRTVTTNALLVYVGGVNDTTGTPTQAGALGVCAIGATHSTPARFMDGNLDDLRVYTSALSAADILLLSQGGEPATAPTARWTFDDGPQYGEPSDGDPIAVFESREGSRYNFVQATAATRPTYDQVGPNNKPALVFSEQYLSHPAQLLTTAAGRIFIVAKSDGNDADSFLSQSDVAKTDELLSFGVSGGKLQYRQDKTTETEDALTGDTALSTTWHVLEYASDGTTVTAFVDGVAQTLTETTGANSGDWGSDNTTGTVDNTVLGGVVGSSAANLLKGSIAEVLVYNTAPTAVNIARIRRALAKKYGVTI
jgi:hypothetical protein